MWETPLPGQARRCCISAGQPARRINPAKGRNPMQNSNAIEASTPAYISQAGAHSVAIICPKTLTAEMHSHVQAKAGV